MHSAADVRARIALKAWSTSIARERGRYLNSRV
jgi:hypothetical protein